MFTYLIKRFLLIFPTLIGIMAINFLVIQFVPGGPVEQMMLKLSAVQGGLQDRLSNNSEETLSTSNENSNSFNYKGRTGLEQELIDQLNEQYGLNKPLFQRFWTMLKNYFTFNFGNSFYQDKSVITLIIEKLPVSASLGIWGTLLVYCISIPLGIMKATREGTQFDISSSTIISVGYAIPGFLFATILIIFFAGGRYFSWFPLRGIVSENFHDLSLIQQIIDYFHHLALPLLSTTISGFATLTLLTKNCFLDQLHLQYVTTARAKGATNKRVLYKHVFRNAMLIIIAGFPATLVSMLFTGSLLTEVIFSLDGLGLLGFEAAIRHDYPVIFGSLFFFSLLGLVLKVISDITYMFIDPRIDFISNNT